MARWKVAARLADELERRRQYRASLVERHLDGSMGGVNTRKLARALLERGSSACTVARRREKCLDCCCCQPSEVDQCTGGRLQSVAVPVWDQSIFEPEGEPGSFASCQRSPGISRLTFCEGWGRRLVVARRADSSSGLRMMRPRRRGRDGLWERIVPATNRLATARHL
jgi:hypothetical protein